MFGLLAGSPASEVKGSFVRLTGPFAQSNTFARYLAFMIVFGVALYPTVSRRLRMMLLPLLGLSTVFLLLTLTRSAILSAVVGIVAVALVQGRKRLLVGFAVCALLAAALVPGLGTRFATLSAGEQVVGGPETGNSLEWRLNYWTEVLPLANSNPVTGLGLNMTQYQTDAIEMKHGPVRVSPACVVACAFETVAAKGSDEIRFAFTALSLEGGVTFLIDSFVTPPGAPFCSLPALTRM